MAKSDVKNAYICSNCGYRSQKWLGQCPDCNEWGTLELQQVIQSSFAETYNPAELKTIADIKTEHEKRISSGSVEFDRVLGSRNDESGFVPAQVVLLSGEPGIGKSTLLLQTVASLVGKGSKAIYVSAEESDIQVAMRARRIVSEPDILTKIQMLNSANLESIIEASMRETPDFIIVDSIQTIFSTEAIGLPGSMGQVRWCASKLVSYAKSSGVVLVLVGHINKQGEIAGPKVLEHLVDTVLQMEGEPNTGLRILRALKNRFGPVNEVGIFDIDSDGMNDLSDPSKYLISDENGNDIGVCHAVVMEGYRPLLIEVQALVNNTPFSMPQRVVEGFSLARLQRIAAILSKYTKYNLASKDIYIKIAGGIRINDPAIDMAIALAIISSYSAKALKSKSIALGELALTGGVMSVNRLDDRLKEAKRLGYKNILSSQNIKSIRDLVQQIK